MEIRPSQILEGVTNLVFKTEAVEMVAAARKAICDKCDYMSENAKKLSGYTTIRVDNHCTVCSCPISTKVRAMSTSCPKNFWTKNDDKEG